MNLVSQFEQFKDFYDAYGLNLENWARDDLQKTVMLMQNDPPSFSEG